MECSKKTCHIGEEDREDFPQRKSREPAGVRIGLEVSRLTAKRRKFIAKVLLNRAKIEKKMF